MQPTFDIGPKIWIESVARFDSNRNKTNWACVDILIFQSDSLVEKLVVRMNLTEKYRLLLVIRDRSFRSELSAAEIYKYENGIIFSIGAEIKAPESHRNTEKWSNFATKVLRNPDTLHTSIEDYRNNYLIVVDTLRTFNSSEFLSFSLAASRLRPTLGSSLTNADGFMSPTADRGVPTPAAGGTAASTDIPSSVAGGVVAVGVTGTDVADDDATATASAFESWDWRLKQKTNMYPKSQSSCSKLYPYNTHHF